MRRAFSLAIASVGALAMVAIATLALAQNSPAKLPPGPVDIRLTSGTGIYRFVTRSRNFAPGSGSNPLKIQVAEDTTYQQIDGIGAALTDSSAWLITHTAEPTRSQILRDLFSPDGIGISYLRLPMGASDFVVTTTVSATEVITHYTYDDMPPGLTDPDLIHFSVAHDEPYIIPILQEAMRLNPKLKIMASPWSPPGWMKTPPDLYGGSFNMQYCDSYAQYFVKFIQAYEDHGIPIDAVTVQNEPYKPATPSESPDYPTMHMEPSEQAYFVSACLGPAFAANGISTKILIWDHNWDMPDYPLAVLDDPDAKGYIAGTAWHCYRGEPSAQTDVHDAHPDKGNYFTECTGSGEVTRDNFGPDLVWGTEKVTVGSTRNWAKTVLYFNLALDEQYGPHIGGCANCRGLLTIGRNGVVTPTTEYYVVAHLSKFIEPGAQRIWSSYITGTLESVAFQNPDTSIVLVALNPGDQSQLFDVQWRDRFFSFSLETRSVATFRWRPLAHTGYLPLIDRDYYSALSFQNFERANGTNGDYFQPVWYMDCSLDSVWPSLGRSLKCRAYWQAADPDPEQKHHGGTVAVYPASWGRPVDISRAKTCSMQVYDTRPTGNTVELKLCDASSCYPNNAVWSENGSAPGTWTRIAWDLSKFTQADKSKIGHIELYEYNDGIYYFDEILCEQ